ncbi:MAG TPA: hypothetical protein DCS82_00365, partial [Rhodospirillaceae bacterium]|nr:hypothetical protein [Rhodospirillaceae bacterium]
MGKIRNFLLCFIFALLSVICLEILLGYSNHLRIFNNTSAIYATIRSVIAQFDEAPRSRSSPLSKHEITGDLPTLNLSKDQNPFAAYPATVGSYRYHPFFDYSGVHLMGAAPIRLDYFGFRNRNSDTYFNVEDDFVVILTGGSEAAGFAHETTIAEHLERFLAKSQNLNGRRVRVLNLSMNSFVLGNEINAFVHLGYRLRPNVVITHSGWNDMINGARVPGPFQVLGLNYMNPMINWLPRLYDLENKTLNNWNHVVETAISSVVEAYLTNLEKYRAIVESSGAYFIAGIQQYDRRPRSDRLHFTTHNLMEELAKQIDQQPSYFSFLGRSDLGFVDTIHTDSKSAHKIAKAYFDHIEYAIAEKKIPTTAPTRTASA